MYHFFRKVSLTVMVRSYFGHYICTSHFSYLVYFS
ncbi:hypothetical protein GGP87_001009 [Salinibacter ruber]|nr:hypothetical protein [Salinibacter ruber]